MSNVAAPRSSAEIPAEVRRLLDQRALRVSWRDGHVSEYSWDYLRGWCPCAGCQGHGNEPRYVGGSNADLVSISVVGNYALGLRWSDGHDTGIYAYRYLRRLCPCSRCLPDEAP